MPYRVLIAATSADIMQSYTKLFETHFSSTEVLLAGNVIEACRAAASENPDIILIECTPGFFNDIIKKLNSEIHTAYIPKIVVVQSPDKMETAFTEENTDLLHPGMTDQEKSYRISRCLSFSANAKKRQPRHWTKKGC